MFSKYAPIEYYVVAIQRLRDEFEHLRNSPVYVMTDDYAALGELRDVMPDVLFLYMTSMIKRNGHAQGMFNEQSNVTRFNATMELLTELQVMREADYGNSSHLMGT